MESTKVIKEHLMVAFDEGSKALADVMALYEKDERKAVQTLLTSFQRKEQARIAEIARVEAMCEFEKKYSDCDFICGIDEVGRGPFAGPVITCAMVLPKDCRILYVNDSKKLSEKKREELCAIIKREALGYALGEASAQVIDEINILQATYQAMRDAIHALPMVPDVLLNDAVRIPQVDLLQEPIIKGDAKSISIACASIVAKVHRDHLMEDFDKIYPGYHFADNKGYGTAAHIQALRELGPCPIHRMSFIHSFIQS